MTSSFPFEAGHVCGDSIDIVDGQPTGSVRVSFGYMSTFEDCQNLLNFVVDCFVEKPVQVNQVRLDRLRTAATSSRHGPSIQGTSDKTEHIEENYNPSEPLLNLHGNRAVTTNANKQAGTYTLTNIYIYPIKSCGAFEVYGQNSLSILYPKQIIVLLKLTNFYLSLKAI